jgi:hypothetical protein
MECAGWHLGIHKSCAFLCACDGSTSHASGESAFRAGNKVISERLPGLIWVSAQPAPAKPMMTAADSASLAQQLSYSTPADPGTRSALPGTTKLRPAIDCLDPGYPSS